MKRKYSLTQVKDRGLLINRQWRRGPEWYWPENYSWYIKVCFPYSGSFSKNRLYEVARKKTKYGFKKPIMYMTDEAREASFALTALVRAELNRKGIKPYRGRVWLDFLVQKPRANVDATNIIDLACDAIKYAIGVDDKWFSIARLDWEIVREDPQIIIGIGQVISRNYRICGACKRVLPEENFPSLGKGKGGAQYCIECLRGEPLIVPPEVEEIDGVPMGKYELLDADGDGASPALGMARAAGRAPRPGDGPYIPPEIQEEIRRMQKRRKGSLC